jgi:hypothetical protein
LKNAALVCSPQTDSGNEVGLLDEPVPGSATMIEEIFVGLEEEI